MYKEFLKNIVLAWWINDNYSCGKKLKITGMHLPDHTIHTKSTKMVETCIKEPFRIRTLRLKFNLLNLLEPFRGWNQERFLYCRFHVFKIPQNCHESLTFWSEFFSGMKDHQIFKWRILTWKYFSIILKSSSELLITCHDSFADGAHSSSCRWTANKIWARKCWSVWHSLTLTNAKIMDPHCNYS